MKPLWLAMLLAVPLGAQTPQCSTTKTTWTCGGKVPHDTVKVAVPVVLHDTVKVTKVDTVYLPVPVPPKPDTQPTPTPPAPDTSSAMSFETGWDGFTNWTGVGAPTGVSRDNTMAAAGSWSVKRAWVPNPSGDGGSQFLYKFAAADRVWLRFSFKLTSSVSTIMKFARFYDQNFGKNYGGLFLQSGSDLIAWGWDQENSAIVTTLGLKESQVIDGKWHTLEVDYWRNGDPSGFPSVAFWFDGVQLQSAPIKYLGAGNVSKWINGRLNAGERNATSGGKLGYQEWLATLNAGNTTTGQVNIDRVSYSTTGRIP